MKSKWMAFFCMLCGAVAGSFVGELCSGIKWLKWLGWSKSLGLSVNEPLDLDLLVVRLRFGASFEISICTIIFIFAALILYRRLSR